VASRNQFRCHLFVFFIFFLLAEKTLQLNSLDAPPKWQAEITLCVSACVSVCVSVCVSDPPPPTPPFIFTHQATASVQGQGACQVSENNIFSSFFSFAFVCFLFHFLFGQHQAAISVQERGAGGVRVKEKGGRKERQEKKKEEKKWNEERVVCVCICVCVALCVYVHAYIRSSLVYLCVCVCVWGRGWVRGVWGGG